jgi:hypothetical protein
MMRQMQFGDWRGAAAAMLFGISLVACATPGASSSQPTATDPLSPSPEPTATESFVASPGPPTPVAVVFRLERSELASYVPLLTLYNDGRLVRLDRVHDSLTVQRLTPLGIDAFVAEVLASGSFQASHNVLLEPLPGVELPGIDPSADRFTLADAGADPVVVINTPYHDPLVFQSSNERETLIALADRVMDTSWLPAEAWKDASPAPFVPEAYLVFSGAYAMPGICPPDSDSEFCKRDVATIDVGFEWPADGIGPPFKSADGTQSVVDHCAVIGPDVANGIAAVLWSEFGSAAGHFYLGVSIPWRELGASYDLTIRPLFPEEEATCAGKSLPPVIGP